MTRSQYTMTQVVLSAFIAGLCLCHRLREGDRDAVLNKTYALACIWMTTFGPSTEACTYLLMTPVLAATLVHAWNTPQPRWYFFAITFSASVHMLGQLELLFPLDKPIQRMQLLPLAGLTFFLALVVRDWSWASIARAAVDRKKKIQHKERCVELELDQANAPRFSAEIN